MVYALAVLVVAGLIFFATANDGAVAHTFLRGEFVSPAWADVAKAFWVNVRVAVGAEILVLVLGLVVAVMRLLRSRVPPAAPCGPWRSPTWTCSVPSRASSCSTWGGHPPGPLCRPAHPT